jgi:hypothetical protein
MSTWGAAYYGDPCRECGFDWTIDVHDAIVFIERLPIEAARHTTGADGSRRRPGGGWTIGEYVSHMADNLRNWAERVQAARLSGKNEVAGYDPDELAIARRYDALPLEAALWSLSNSCRAWTAVLRPALTEGVVLIHEDRGTQTAQDVARNNSHDTWHHLWDIDAIRAAGHA